jgi:hypothetical protein
VSDVGSFLTAIAPALFDLGRELFKTTGGDPVKARKVIRSRIAEFKRAQAANDAAADRKFGRR